MSISGLSHRPHRRRASRPVVVALLILSYLFAGLAHDWLDIDVATPSVTVASMFGNDAPAMSSVAGEIKPSVGKPHTDVAPYADCHGCFSVAVPLPVMTGRAITLPSAMPAQPQPRMAGIARAIDTPPPKTLS